MLSLLTRALLGEEDGYSPMTIFVEELTELSSKPQTFRGGSGTCHDSQVPDDAVRQRRQRGLIGGASVHRDGFLDRIEFD
jgi:hypothetical protein